ncbi:CIS tube protein [Reichenbachiella versicolor]|uniref:CIS tube protein n=1 Tax=Reichenbachiella versicolor TaxID=1821036 RepID=UPI0013A545A0|nr:peptidoglycan-binding protein [Reichenbachiella versicolor]
MIPNTPMDLVGTKLTIDNKKEKFQVQVNPTSISLTKGIGYNPKNGMGSDGATLTFKSKKPTTLSFEILFDGTGALGFGDMSRSLSKDHDVDARIKKLEDVVLKYQSAEHETPLVKVDWGELIFEGRLTSLDYTHSMFKPGGKLLRTKAKLTFTSSEKEEKIAKRQNENSPDLTHLVTVKAGDTLPSMCQKIYKDSQYYLQVAKVNSLTSFRALKPGMQILFPPLKK